MGEDSVELVLTLLRTSMGEKYTYFDGDPDLIAKHDLPAIVVEQTGEVTVGGTFGEDDTTDTVLVKVILDKSDDWTPQAEKLNLTHRKVRKIINERGVDGKYLPGTVKGALRRELDGGRRINHELAVDYGFLRRPEDVFTSEGHVTVKIEYSNDYDPNAN